MEHAIKGMEIKKKKHGKNLRTRLKELLNTKAKDLWVYLRMGFWRLVKNFAEQK